jgi:hypothetical protein
MAMAEQNAENATENGNEKSPDKKISRNGKGSAGFADTPEIKDSDQDQNADAKGNQVR